MKTVNDIRREFIQFFVGKGHTHVPSSPLVPQNDPTLMFANSGMVQFKNVFTGVEKRPYTKATTAQKSVRAGGKHNDLDNVGYTARHHTFFEMMGNFSFGDYFKEEAISYAWELVHTVFGMPKDKLLVTVHSSDEEAAALWRKIAGFEDSRIIRIPTNDNFWMMGDTGPCGPCSEIFFDQGDTLFGGPPGSKDQDGDRFLEFWNLVFMQFEQEPDGEGGHKRKALPKPSIDTGMGLERMAALMQGKTSNFDIDLLRSIIEHCADLTGISPDGTQAPSHRVIADHLRCAVFLIADGVMPSNEGRGYVLRRIMRRGMRHAHMLGAQEPLMYKLVPTLTAMMGDAYPEIRRAEAAVTETLRSEESRFKKTLDRGLRILDEETESLAEGQKLSGEIAFKLYDTYGFPIDLTQDALKNKGVSVDIEGFQAAMDAQRETARKSWAGSGDVGTETFWFDILDSVGATEFLGYRDVETEGQVRALVKSGDRVDSLAEGSEGMIIVNQSPFYAESGGQVGDTGRIVTPTGSVFEVTDTKKLLGKLWVHVGKVSKGTIAEGESVLLQVDAQRRDSIRANHSATHLLHEALRRVLGDHISQKGSLQDDQRTRFDISHPQAVSSQELRKVEEIVNQEIREDHDVVTRVLPLDEAIDTGARALFGEKYDEEVRVISMGRKKEGQNSFSVELCGGTHVSRTGEIGLFKIVSEGAVSAGIRRVEALTGANALRYFEEQEQRVHDLVVLLKTPPSEIESRVKSLMEDKKRLETEVASLRRQLATGGGSAGEASAVREIAGVRFLGRVLKDFPAKDLKPMADEMKGRLGAGVPGVVALISTEEGKASVVVALTKEATGRLSAVDLVKVAAGALGGSGGGGRPDMAQAGGPNAQAAEEALAAIETNLASA